MPEPPEVYSFTDAALEAYWYSRFNLGMLSMGSGMGPQLMPPPEMVMTMMERAGIDAPPKKNPHLTMAVFASADPSLTAPAFDPDDLLSFRLDPTKMDTRILTAANAMAIIKEIEWAKMFEAFPISAEFPDANVDHFLAQVFFTLGPANTNFLVENLRAENGLFQHAWQDGSVVDSSLVPMDQIAMLWALADVASATKGWEFYQAPLGRDMALGLADRTFTAIVAENVLGQLTTARERGMALQALTWYAAHTEDKALRQQAKAQISALADGLVDEMAINGKLPAPAGANQAASQGAVVAGLLFAFNATGNTSYQVAGLRAWRYLQGLWNADAGVYKTGEVADKYVYTPQDVGDILAAFNSMLHILAYDVGDRFAIFFRNSVKASGLQLAEGSDSGGATDEDEVPAPPQVGKIPVMASEVTYDVEEETWEVTNGQFDTEMAMYASNEMIWIGIWDSKPAVPSRGIPKVPRD
ncbi:MAG: hypothetical protein ACE5IG_01540 [Dehalococcoidia bacterium]